MSAGVHLRVDVARQRLSLLDGNDAVLAAYLVSTARNGMGEQSGSNCTPRGRHVIRACIGAGAPAGAVFRGRRPTGEIWTPQLAAAFPQRDWILSRILWLSGGEPGRNRLGPVDSMRRYIYIHGTGDDQPMGLPLSHGCVRMRNRDVIELFERVGPGTPVDIVAGAPVQLTLAGWDEARAEAYPLRCQVFVEEQGVPLAMELDEFDPACRHALARNEAGQLVGTGRLLPDGHIGRMAVHAGWRGRGIGSALLTALMGEAHARGLSRVMLSAQTQAEGFYRGFGFLPEGPVYEEAGLPHQAMARSLAGGEG